MAIVMIVVGFEIFRVVGTATIVMAVVVFSIIVAVIVSMVDSVVVPIALSLHNRLVVC